MPKSLKEFVVDDFRYFSYQTVILFIFTHEIVVYIRHFDAAVVLNTVSVI